MADETYMSAYASFREALEQLDKPRCVQLALNQLETKAMGIVELYTQVLAPSLNSMTQDETALPVAVWREHIRSAIIRTIIECCYPYLLEEMTINILKLDIGTVVIVSPTDEYHELGARMGSDFFNLCGYRTLFVGANTPKGDMIHGLEIEHPDYVVINAVNYYNVFRVKALITEIHSVLARQRILVSGYAFRQDKDLYKTVGAIGISVQIFIGSLIQGLQKSLVNTTISNSSLISILADTDDKLIQDYEQVIDTTRKADTRITKISPVLDQAALIIRDERTESILIRGFDFAQADPIYDLENRLIEGSLPAQDDDLDSDTTETIYDMIRTINDRYKTTFVIITHDRKIAEKADRIVEIKDGRINLDVARA